MQTRYPYIFRPDVSPAPTNQAWIQLRDGVFDDGIQNRPWACTLLNGRDPEIYKDARRDICIDGVNYLTSATDDTIKYVHLFPLFRKKYHDPLMLVEQVLAFESGYSQMLLQIPMGSLFRTLEHVGTVKHQDQAINLYYEPKDNQIYCKVKFTDFVLTDLDDIEKSCTIPGSIEARYIWQDTYFKLAQLSFSNPMLQRHSLFCGQENEPKLTYEAISDNQSAYDEEMCNCLTQLHEQSVAPADESLINELMRLFANKVTSRDPVLFLKIMRMTPSDTIDYSECASNVGYRYPEAKNLSELMCKPHAQYRAAQQALTKSVQELAASDIRKIYLEEVMQLCDSAKQHQSALPLLTQVLWQTNYLLTNPTADNQSKYLKLNQELRHKSWGKKLGLAMLAIVGATLFVAGCASSLGAVAIPVGVLSLISTVAGVGFFAKAVKKSDDMELVSGAMIRAHESCSFSCV